MSKSIKLKKLIKEDITYAPEKQNLGFDTERFGNYKIHKFKNLYHVVGKDLDLTAYDNNGKIIAGGIDKNTFKAKSYEDIIEHFVSFYKANPQAYSVDLSDRETGESLAAMQRTKFDEQNLKEIQAGDNDKIILNFEKTKDDILKELPKITFNDFTGLELKVLTDHLQQSLYMIKKKRLSIGSMNEDSAFEKNYLPNAIKDFVSKADTASPYKPQIKLHWAGDTGESNTKWLAVTWDMITKFIDIVSRNK